MKATGWPGLAFLGNAVSSVEASGCNKNAIKSLLPEGANVLDTGHYPANATFTPPEEYKTGAFGPATYVLPRAACVFQANLTLLGNTQHSIGLV